MAVSEEETVFSFKEQIVEMEELRITQQKSYQFLVTAYLLSKDNWRSGLSFGQVLEELGWQSTEYDDVENFLKIKGLIKRHSFGGLQGTFRVTHAGIVEVERLIMNDNVVAVVTDDTVSGEKRNLNLKEKIQEKQEKRGEFLQRIYEATNGKALHMVQIRPIAEAMGISEREAYGLEQYLVGANLIKRKTGGGWNGCLQINKWAMQQIQHLLLHPEESVDGVKIKQPRGPNLDTQVKIEELHKLRKRHIRNGVVELGWVAACQQIGIDTKTVIKHDPELRARWHDPNYH